MKLTLGGGRGRDSGVRGSTKMSREILMAFFIHCNISFRKVFRKMKKSRHTGGGGRACVTKCHMGEGQITAKKVSHTQVRPFYLV